jgi:hypothetical protein
MFINFCRCDLVVSAAFMIESMCFKKLNIALPESMTRKGPGKKQSENPQEEGVVEEEEVEDNGGQNDRTVSIFA